MGLISQGIVLHLARYCYGYLVILSLLTSLYFIAGRETVNTDAVVYLSAAEALVGEGLDAARDITPLVFLPLLIAWLSQLTGLSLIVASDVINTLGILGVNLGVLLLVRQLGGGGRESLLTLALLFLFPTFAGYKDSVYRDTGYWALMLFSFYCYLRFYSGRHYRWFAGWLVLVFAASLLRPEAAVFFILPLLLVLLAPGKTGWRDRRRLTRLSLLVSAVLALLAAFVLFSGAAVRDIYLYLMRYFLPENIFILDTGGYLELVPGFYPQDYAWLGLLLSLLPAYLDSLVRALSWPFTLMLGWLWWRQPQAPGFPPVYLGYIVIALMVPGIFLIMTGFLTPRYMTLFALLALLRLPFLLASLIDNLAWTGRRFGLVLFVLLVLCLDTYVSFGHSKAFYSDAVQWTNRQTAVDARVMSNERNVAYSINRPKLYDDVDNVFWRWDEECLPGIIERYDYFLEVAKRYQEDRFLNCQLRGEEVARFSNERNDRIVIYRIQP